MEPRAYSELVKAERTALAALQRKLKNWGSGKTPTLADVAVAWNTWTRLAGMIERANAD